MFFLVVLAVVAVTVAVVALQNGEAVTVWFLFWRLEAPLALVILAATGAGLVIGGLIGFARALRRWGHRRAESETRPGANSRASATAPDHRVRSWPLR